MQETKVLHKKKVLAPKLRFKGFEDAWIKSRLGDIATITTGNTPSTTVTEYYNGPKLFVSPADINENRYVYKTKTTLTDLGFKQGRKITKGSVLFVCIGSTIGKVGQAADECLTNQQINALNAMNEFDNNFIYAILERNGKKIKLLAGTQAVPQINKTDFSNFKYNFPTLPEQQKIAAFLSAVDEKIQLLNKKKQLLEQYKKGVMQQLFSGKLRFKGHTDKWKKVVFTECCDLIHGFQFREEHFESTGLPVIKIGSLVDNGSISFHNATYVSKDCEHTHSKFILKKGDVLMALTGGTLGKVSLIDKDYGVIFQNYRVGKFENKSNSIKKYIYFLLQSNLVQNRIQSLVNEAAQPNFGKQDFDKIKFSLPSLEEQKKIADFLSAIDVKIESLSNQISQTQNFKKGLLQQMFV